MSSVFGAAAGYGQTMTVKSAQCPLGRVVRGFISPIDGEDTARLDRPLRPGRLNDERYLLLAPPAAMLPGETELTVSAGGRVYELLRRESVMLGPDINHWEGVLRLKEAGSNA